jgi:threonine synthase
VKSILGATPENKGSSQCGWYDTWVREDALPLASQGIIRRYSRYLPVTSATPVVTLCEGGTPLLFAARVSDRVSAEVYLKIEGANPTGSFKDRGMTVAVSKAVEADSEAIVCASTGNTSASAAAYAALAGIRCLVLIPEGSVALGKLAQALFCGAQVLQVRDNFDRALEIVRGLPEHRPVTIVNSINPFRIEGQKTAAFEVVEALGDSPDLLCIPVGNAGNITAYWRGFREYAEVGIAKKLPRLLGAQAAGAAPIVLGHSVADPETVATAIRIGNPASWSSASAAVSESGGAFLAVSDDEILAAQQFLARQEGVFCEPASAAAVAGLFKAGADRAGRVVCVLTGHGLKDPDLAVNQVGVPVVIEATETAVLSALET